MKWLLKFFVLPFALLVPMIIVDIYYEEDDLQYKRQNALSSTLMVPQDSNLSQVLNFEPMTFDIPRVTPKRTGLEAVIATVVCGKHHNTRLLVLLKSAVLFTPKNESLRFIIFTDKKLFSAIENIVKKVSEFGEFTYEILVAGYPYPKAQWRKMFKKCATLKLFLPTLLPQDDRLIFADVDTFFLSSPFDLFGHFKNFGSSQIAGMVAESEHMLLGTYNDKFSKSFHPYWGATGLNSGIILMNLKSMRELKVELEYIQLYKRYRRKVKFGDQGILNIYFSKNPEQVYALPCEYNYRSDHCSEVTSCPANDGVKIFHGNRGMTKLHNEIIFCHLFVAIKEYKPGTNQCKKIIEYANSLHKSLQIGVWRDCNKISKKFLKIPRQIMGDC